MAGWVASPSAEATRPPVAVRPAWARLIRKSYAADPLVYPRCGGRMQVIAVIEQDDVCRPPVPGGRVRPGPACPAARPVPCRLTRPRALESLPRTRALALGNPATFAGSVFPRAPGPFVMFSSARVRHLGFPTSDWHLLLAFSNLLLAWLRREVAAAPPSRGHVAETFAVNGVERTWAAAA